MLRSNPVKTPRRFAINDHGRAYRDRNILLIDTAAANSPPAVSDQTARIANIVAVIRRSVIDVDGVGRGGVPRGKASRSIAGIDAAGVERHSCRIHVSHEVQTA